MMRFSTILFACAFASAATAQQGPIIHDGEFRFLQAQKGEVWAEQDGRVDTRLAEIREANDGKRPNFLYVLIDDVSFGLMGNRR